VNVGEVTVFVNLSWSRIDPMLKNGRIVSDEPWEIDSDTGALKPISMLDLNGHDMVNVRAIS